MSKYTTEVRYICETFATTQEENPSVMDYIETSRESIFDFDYPIFDDEYKPVLETKILMHYYTREIGLETVGLWKLKLMSRLNDIMPYYNQLYRSELLEFNPLVDVDLKTQHIGSSDNISSGSNENEGERQNIGNTTSFNGESATDYKLFSDTPQGDLDGVESQDYLTNATKITRSSAVNGRIESLEIGATKDKGSYTGTINTTNQYIDHIIGKNGGENYSKKLTDFRKTFLNIDMRIIEELKDLFMYLW